MVVPGSEPNSCNGADEISEHIGGRYGIAVGLVAVGRFFDRVKRECDRDGFRRGPGMFAGFPCGSRLRGKECLQADVACGACPCEWRVLLSVIE
jgi:hypothetical protein